MTHDELPLRRRARGQVHAIQHHAGPDKRLDDADGLIGNRFLRLLGRGANVVRAPEVGQVEDRIIEIGHRLRWFGVEDVQAHAQLAAL